IGVLLCGDALPWPDDERGALDDDSFLLLLSAHDEPLTFRVPEDARALAPAWVVDVDTAGLSPRAWGPPGDRPPAAPAPRGGAGRRASDFSLRRGGGRRRAPARVASGLRR